jgi:HEAT repeat protein
VTSGLAQLSVGEFDKAMQECSPPLRELLSNRLPSLPRSGNDWADDAVALGRRLLGDESSAIRGNACNLLARCTDARAVPDLLTALRDPHEKVRKAAGEALAAIRFYHEQQGHWDRTFKGAPRLDANSAAEALVKQADGKQKKSTRLLAIESMGLLGKVETLPFLIDYTLESDAEIVSAARAAIAAVQAKAAVNGK